MIMIARMVERIRWLQENLSRTRRPAPSTARLQKMRFTAAIALALCLALAKAADVSITLARGAARRGGAVPRRARPGALLLRSASPRPGQSLPRADADLPSPDAARALVRRTLRSLRRRRM